MATYSYDYILRNLDDDEIVDVKNFEITAGLFVRRQVKIQLDTAEFKYREYKGLFDTTFVIYGEMSGADLKALVRWVRKMP